MRGEDQNVMYRFVRFRYITAALIAVALLSAIAFSLLISWRIVASELESSSNRAVFNADRLIDRTVTDLARIDSLRGQPCDAATRRVLQDVVYTSLSQIREVGLIRDGRLYCTNFGPTDTEIPIPAALTQPGTHLDIAPNKVITNNMSLFVYVSRERGTAVNALFNPQVLAEFERDFAYAGSGRLQLRFAPNHPLAPDGVKASDPVYTVGEISSSESRLPVLERSSRSSRSAFEATAEATLNVWTRGMFSLLPTFLIGFGAIGALCGFAIHRWLLRGNLDRLRYLGALQRDEFVMHYQPIVAAATLKIVGVEALLRWKHPRRGLLRAAQFADIFSQDAISAPLTKRVIDLVSADLARVPSELKFWCTINVPPTLLEDNRVLAAISQQIMSVGAGRLQIEITERAPLGEYAEVLLHELRTNGVKVGMDDLGTGYANLSQLQRMPFDFIKIDGMLVRSIQTPDGVTPVVKSLIDLALQIGSEVVVEGVETKTQADALVRAGATHLQGFYFDAARPIEEIIDIMRAQSQA
ncbi:MAG: cyclic diguanylate phosphodiesterase [Betaproteobacteria bacterium]|nr:MAG: cyclic diguanylate phosphodiesterase [Betaproteobacteria bacterium]